MRRSVFSALLLFFVFSIAAIVGGCSHSAEEEQPAQATTGQPAPGMTGQQSPRTTEADLRRQKKGD